MRNFLSIVLLFLGTLPVFSQIKTVSGDLSILKDVKELSVTFGYDTMEVHGYPSEEEFIEVKAQLREKHEVGSGIIFRESWVADRDTVYEPLFIEYFNDAIPKKRTVNVLRNNPNAKYNLHVETVWIYPGYNVGFSHPSKIDIILRLYEITNPDKILWESERTRIQAKVAPYKRERRIGAAYAAAAMKLSWYVRKKAK